MPRERIYRDQAEKQRAYRDRVTAEDRDAYRKLYTVVWDAVESYLGEVPEGEERARYRRLLVKHMPAPK